MTRWLFLGLLLALALSTSAFADDITQKKAAVDSQISTLHGRLASQQQEEAGLRSQISDVTARIRGLEAQVGDVSLRLQTLNEDLSLHRKRLQALNKLFAIQTTRFHLLQRNYKLAVQRLNQRLVAIYESNEDTVSTLDVVLGSGSIESAMDGLNYVTRIHEEDASVKRAVAQAKLAIQQARKKTAKLRNTIYGESRAIASRAEQARQDRAALVGAQSSLSSTQHQKLVALSSLTSSEQAEAGEIDALQASSAALAEQIRAEQQSSSSASTATRSSAGLIWPVTGPITSPFGWRWGRMHQGIDIGVPTGTPIHAAAAGKVIYCGWEEGYGNLVVLDNGGNLATAYAHQSAIAVTCGEQVGQGETIGYVGCTGHCTGPHLHFEVRINGNPVDPLGYL
ncbi:MAG TPA: peptidoglycan DD-metalloendopeptidase family protein [Gaiellaceae bacterium]|nr:peptidoglycan DD-metalloendopeptidase family protein [Gaiellaceae bacterium]